MSLTFYYSPMSTSSITHLVLEELGVPYEKVRVDLSKGEQHRPEFLKLNPNGMVPVVVHDGQPIFESVAITLYLGETFGVERGLFPAPGPGRAQAFEWLVWAHVSLYGPVQRLQHASSPRVPAEQHNAAAAASARQDVEKRLAIFDEVMTGRSFVVGDHFTLVDAHLASFIGYLGMVGFDLARYPALHAWQKSVSARPSVARVMAG